MAAVAPLTLGRILAWLQEQDYRFNQIEDDPDTVYTSFNNMKMALRVRKEPFELLYIRMNSGMMYPQDQYEMVRESANTWNLQHFFPKAFAEQQHTFAHLSGECAWDMDAGVTKAQLADFLDRAIAAGVALKDYEVEQLGHLAMPTESD